MNEFSILSNFTPLKHEHFAAHRELEARLKATLHGDVLFDLGSRALYAADASNYRQLPIGVILPRDAADVEAALAACRATSAAVLARGAGTSLAGQCANVAVVFDYSRYMNQLTSIDPTAKLATVQPGIVLDRLREAAELHHLTYAPDPATHSRCTLGGMIGNNSCGVHGLLGGKVADNVESLDIVLYDGTRMTVGRTSPDQLQAIIHAGGRTGMIYAGLASLRDRYSTLIREKFPRIPRRVSGYNLDELLDESGFHVARALVGTEGTCANIVSATLNLTASPPFRVLTVLGFPDAFLAADAVPQVLEHGPIGLEGFDALLLEFMRRKGLSPRDLPLLPAAGGHLLVEMGAWDAAEAQAKAEALVRAAQSWPTPPVARIYSADQAARVWHVRESALGSTVFVPGEPEGWEGWEDAGIPPVHLGNYLRKLTALMAEYGYRSPLYGHYGQGCVHLRINFDFRTEQGLRNFRHFLDRAADLVLSFGGSLSGEHGDGQARAALLPKMFGPELMQAFREFKALWDPDNRMNPGKLIDAVRVYDPIENLRHHLRWDQLPSAGPRQSSEKSSTVTGHDFSRAEQTASSVSGHDLSRAEQTTTKSGALAPERAVGPPETPTREAQSAAPQAPGAPSNPHPSADWVGDHESQAPSRREAQSPALQVLETHFAFTADQGSFERATERCVGVGACRKAEGGVMCPSYRATGQEQHSTRGRARLLWEMLAGALREEGFQSHAVHEALDLCLSCKACKTECPVQVDMAAYKSEFLAQRYKGRLHPLHHYIFGFADKLARYGSLAPALTNVLLTGPLTSPLIKRIAGVAQQRALPKLAQHSYQHSRAATNPRAPSIRHLSGEWVGDHDASARTAQLAPPQVASASSVTGHDFSRAEETANKHGALAPGGTSGAPGLASETWETKNAAPPLAVPSSNPDAPSPRLPSGARVGDHESQPASTREAQLAAPQVPQLAAPQVPQLAPPQVPQLAPPQVVLWPDTWNNYYHPQTLAAAETVLTQAGFRVETPTGHICCGRPLYDFGLLDAARAYLAKILDRMAPQIDAGLPFIFLEPSCASVFKDELLELFPNDPRARRLSQQTWLLADWLAANAPDFATGRLAGAHILIHGHCHHKAVFGGPVSEIALLRQAGATVESIQAGCCGMAGPFGFEAGKFEVSKAIAQDGLLPAVESAGPMTILVADGFSCREQIDQLGHKQALHFAEVLARTCGCSG